jgi:hypothetical protein
MFIGSLNSPPNNVKNAPKNMGIHGISKAQGQYQQQTILDPQKIQTHRQFLNQPVEMLNKK